MEKTILLVDDDPDLIEVLQGYLEGVDAKILTALNGEDALSILDHQHVDVLVTDIILPSINGIKLTEIANKKFPNLKVLACSGGGDSGKLVASLALDQVLMQGANKALLKPFTEEEFLRKILALLGKK